MGHTAQGNIIPSFLLVILKREKGMAEIGIDIAAQMWHYLSEISG